MIITKNSVFTVLFAFALLLVNAIRSIQLILMTDASTGFYYENYEGLSAILTVVTVVAIIIILLLNILSKQKKKLGLPKPNNFLGISQIMLGVCMAVEPFFVVSVPTTVPHILNTVKTVTVILSGLVFVILGFVNFLGKRPNYILLIIPTISYVARILVTFICYTGMSGIAANIYEILNLCFILAFLHFSSKILCDITNNRTSIFTNMFAILAIISSSVCSIPQMAATIFGNQGLHTAVDSIITNLFVMIYIIAFMSSQNNIEKPSEASE